MQSLERSLGVVNLAEGWGHARSRTVSRNSTTQRDATRPRNQYCWYGLFQFGLTRVGRNNQQPVWCPFISDWWRVSSGEWVVAVTLILSRRPLPPPERFAETCERC